MVKVSNGFCSNAIATELVGIRTSCQFRVGDEVEVEVVCQAGKRKNQLFEGTVISIRKLDTGPSFILRKVQFGFGTEFTFHLSSPLIASVHVKRSAGVRRAKLYYLRHQNSRQLEFGGIKTRA